MSIINTQQIRPFIWAVGLIILGLIFAIFGVGILTGLIPTTEPLIIGISILSAGALIVILGSIWQYKLDKKNWTETSE
jgi:uncharacterized membrane protein